MDLWGAFADMCPFLGYIIISLFDKKHCRFFKVVLVFSTSTDEKSLSPHHNGANYHICNDQMMALLGSMDVFGETPPSQLWPSLLEKGWNTWIGCSLCGVGPCLSHQE